MLLAEIGGLDIANEFSRTELIGLLVSTDILGHANLQN